MLNAEAKRICDTNDVELKQTTKFEAKLEEIFICRKGSKSKHPEHAKTFSSFKRQHDFFFNFYHRCICTSLAQIAKCLEKHHF